MENNNLSVELIFLSLLFPPKSGIDPKFGRVPFLLWKALITGVTKRLNYALKVNVILPICVFPKVLVMFCKRKLSRNLF